MSGPLFVAGMQVPALGSVSPNARPLLPGGNTFYVGNYPASSSLKQSFVNGNGLTPDTAFATLFGASGGLAALGGRLKCGDVIYVLPGHVENVSAADMASDTGAASGFSILGLGSGTQRPAFNWTAAGSTWLLDTDGVEIANCILNLAGILTTPAVTVATPITVTGVGCRIVDCQINWGMDTDNVCGSVLGAIAVTTAGDYFEFIGNVCINLDVAGTVALCLLSLNGADYCKINRNRIFGATTVTTVGPVHFLTTLSSDVEIVGNYIENLVASSTIAISSAVSGVTGFIGYNMFRVNVAISPVTVSANISCTFFQNYCSDTVNLNGALVVGGGTAT
jgi:hypothetical protein